MLCIYIFYRVNIPQRMFRGKDVGSNKERNFRLRNTFGCQHQMYNSAVDLVEPTVCNRYSSFFIIQQHKIYKIIKDLTRV